MKERYRQNIGDRFPEEIQNICLTKTIAIIGAGGVGGYIIDHFARLGVKKIIIFDGDNFEMSNINRQRFCNLQTIGKNKAEATKEAINDINDEVEVIAINDYFSNKYFNLIISNNVDVVIYAADPYVNIVELGEAVGNCLLHHIPVINGGVGNTKIMVNFIDPTNLHQWFELKNSLLHQSVNDDAEYISSSPHYNSLAACFMMEMFVSYMKNPKLTSYSFNYNIN